MQDKDKKRTTRKPRLRQRMAVVVTATVLVLLASGGVAGYLQLVQHDTLLAEARRNYATIVPLDDIRGDVVDRNGKLLATSVDVDSVWVDPFLVEEPELTAQLLSEELLLPYDEVYRRVTRRANTAPIKRRVPSWEVEAVRALNLTGIRVVEATGPANKGTFDIVASPIQITEPEETTRKLAEVLDLDEATIHRAVTRKARFVYVKRRISARESSQVQSLGRKGVDFSKERRRYYPKKEVGGQLLGFVGAEGVGLEGVELSWEERLQGNRVEIPALMDKSENKSFPEPIPAIPRFAGDTVVLTIDEKIQEQAELILERTVILSRALSGMLVIMDVKTGELLATANVPRMNPNAFSEFPYDRRRNRAFSDAFEPGSTFKIFTLAAALDAGVVTMDDVFDLEGGSYRIGEDTITDTRREQFLNVRDIVRYSSNIGFAKMGELLGRERLYDSLSAFGFGTRPGTGLRGEAPGLLHPIENWAPITFANISFGQGVSVSAVQIVRATAAIGNECKLMRPIIVREIRDSNGNLVVRHLPQVERAVCSPETASTLLEALALPLHAGGTGAVAASERFIILGKTGTSQKPDEILGGYQEDTWTSLFVGLAPARDPRIAVVVLVDEPVGRASGGVVAGPALRDTMEWTLDYLGVAPDHVPIRRTAAITPGEGVAALGRIGAAQENTPEESAETTDEPLGGSEHSHTFVPDLRGLTVGNVRDRAHRARLQVRVQGSGVASYQHPAPGARVPTWSPINVEFSAE